MLLGVDAEGLQANSSWSCLEFCMVVPFVKFYFVFSYLCSASATWLVQATQFGMKKNTLLLLYGFYSSTTYVDLKG